MAKNKEIGNVPNLRFKGFEGEWEERTLEELSTKIGDGLHGTPVYAEGTGYYFINGNNLTDGTVRIITNTKEVSQKDWLRNDKKSNLNTLFLSINGTIGNVARYNGENLMLGKSVAYINFKQNSEYYFHVLSSQKIQNYFIGELTGSTIKNLSLKTIRESVINVPSFEEQSKISNLLSLIDNRIQTQSKIIEQFKSLISKLTDEFFSDQTELGSFGNSWITYSVSEILEFFPTNSVSWENLDYEHGELFNLHYGMIHKNQTKLMDVSRKQLPYIKKDVLLKKPVLCRSGDVVFADASEDLNDVGKVVEFMNCADHKIASGLHTIHARDKMNLTIDGFKAFAFSSKYFKNQIKRLAHGTKVYSISVKKLQECTIRIPSKEVQLKIVGVLNGLEAKIDIESNILHQLKQQKDYLLKNLFI